MQRAYNNRGMVETGFGSGMSIVEGRGSRVAVIGSWRLVVGTVVVIVGEVIEIVQLVVVAAAVVG